MVNLAGESWSYLSDRPVGMLGDLLWEGEVVREQIGRIAKTVVSPLLTVSLSYTGEVSNSITFAVYGKWGTGKSSVLRMIQDTAKELAGDKRLHFCHYVASRYQSRSLGAFTTLSLRVLAALAGSPQEAVEKFLPQAASFSNLNQLLPGQGDNEARNLAVLEKIAASLAELVDFDTILADYLNGSDGQKRVLVVLIDDLDRCDTPFAWEVLNAIQQLSDIPNLFFILAVDKEYLDKVIKEQFVRGDGNVGQEFALEKYIQVAISIPAMGQESLEAFVQELLKDYIEGDITSRAIVDNVQFVQKGLQELTPRSVKRCLTAIRADLDHLLKPEASFEEQQKAVKESVLKYTWPDFYHRYFLPTKNPKTEEDQQLQHAFTTLETVCTRFHEDRDQFQLRFEVLRFNLERIAATYSLNWTSLVDEKLADYLGTSPYWLVSGDKPGMVGAMPAQDKPRSTESPQDATAERELLKAPAKLVDLTNPEDEFLRLYLEGETAEAAGRKQETFEKAAALYSLVARNRERFGTRYASMVGNVAINAEALGQIELATDLYELALELDPEHSNNMQNFADFIIKKGVADLYPRAQELLARLKTGKHAHHKQERTLALEIRLQGLMSGEPGAASTRPGDREIEEIVEQFLAGPPTRQRFNAVMELLSQLNDFARMRVVARDFYDRASSDNDRYAAVRSLADVLAASPEAHDELEAMDIYRYLRDHPTSEEARADLADIDHNYATLLYKYDYDDEAGRLWFEAYNLKPDNGNIRRAYVFYLLRAGHPDVAEGVMRGEALPETEMYLQPKVKDMPDRFLDEEIDRWWVEVTGRLH